MSADGDTAFLVDADDPDLALARHVAQCTLGQFVRRFAAPPATQTELMLKATFRDRDAAEHLWVRVLAAAGDTVFRGVVENDPADLPRLHYGDTVAVARASVDDWYAVDRDTLVAGFSIRVHRNRLPPAERVQYDRSYHHVVDADSAARARLEWRCR